MGDTNVTETHPLACDKDAQNAGSNDLPKDEACVPHTSIALPHLDSSSTVSESLGKERSVWSRKMDFFLSCVGYAVGLGNIWRFPYLCYKSGGGAFIIPYLTFLFVCAYPCFFLEMSLGQFGSQGPITIWKIAPLFKGLGYGMAIVSVVACVYYNVIIAWSLYYIYQSYFVPWASCDNEWNTLHCTSKSDILRKTVFGNQTTGSYFVDNITQHFINSSVPTSTSGDSLVRTASQEFWLFKVLQLSSGIESLGQFQKSLVICLFIAWLIVFFCVVKGIKSSGKVVYVTATFPYVVLIIFLIRGVTLPGAWEGISFYLTPQWSLLLTFEVWLLAAIQIFFSVGAGWGALLTMASYNKFDNNVYRDAMVVPMINCGTSILAGFVVFSYIGFMAHETGKSIEDVVEQGPGLAFIVYPYAISLLPVPSLWAFLFFFMLLAVGLDTQFGMFETAVSAVLDEYPEFLGKRKTAFVAVLCVLLFLLGLPCVTQGGMYIVQLMDFYCAAFSLMVISLLECVAVAWIYGIDRFLLDISLMTKRKPSLWWKLCWAYITPLTIVALLLFLIISHTSVTYDDYVYPGWSIGLGWIIAMCSIVPIPLVALIKIFKTEGSLVQRIIKNLRPEPEWGPALEENKLQYKKSLTVVPPRFQQLDVDVSFDLDQVTSLTDEMAENLPFDRETIV